MNQGHTLNSDAGDLQGARHTEVKSRHRVSGHRIRTRVVRVRPTRSPNLPLGPHESWLGHKVPDGWAPKVERSGFLEAPGFLEASLVPEKSSSPASGSV